MCLCVCAVCSCLSLCVFANLRVCACACVCACVSERSGGVMQAGEMGQNRVTCIKVGGVVRVVSDITLIRVIRDITD